MNTFPLLFLLLVTTALALSPMTVITAAPTYTTGAATLVASSANKVNDTPQTLSVAFTTPAPSSSLNASIALQSCEWDIRNNPFGWKLVIGSLSATGMMVTFSTPDSGNYIRLLIITYIANWAAPFNLNYVLFTLNPASDPLANNSLSTIEPCTTPSGSCRAQLFTGIAYSSLGSINTVRLFLAGVFVRNIPSSSSFVGISPSVTSTTSTSFSVRITTYNSAQLSQFSLFHLSYDSALMTSPWFAYAGSGKVGCFYTTTGCGNGGSISNTKWTTSNQPFSFYSPQFYFYGLNAFMVSCSSNSDTGNFQTQSTTLVGGGAYSNSFLFYGNGQLEFNMNFHYFFLLQAQCPLTGDIYLVYGSSTTCDSACNSWIGQYADINRICQLCNNTCYMCTGPLNSQCTSCYNYQNRVLSGNVCICDPMGFYDDGSSLVCPSCHYSCKSCTGPSSSQCTACESTYHRSLVSNTCPCVGAYYNSGTQVCSPCHTTCATCTGSTSSTCLSCYPAMFRTLVSTSCSCMVGYYDDGSAGRVCASCLYSCLTCSVTNTNCTSCDASKLRFPSGTTCPCMNGYYDALVPLCVACHPTCLTCSGPLSNNCLSCNNLANRALSGTSCLCTTGFYDLSNVCTPCHSSCLNCSSGTATTCTACSLANFRYYSSEQCLCSTGYFQGGTSSCLSCHYSCLACSITSTNCTSCDSAKYRTIAGFTCPCDTGFVDVLLTGSCSPCHYSCLTCSGTASSQCTSCLPIRTSTTVPGSCSCPIGYYDNGTSTTCQLCSPYCLTCIDQYTSSCTSCNSALFRTITYSYTGAPSGNCLCMNMYYDPGVPLCQPCSATCLTCTLIPTNCTSCYTVQHRSLVAPNLCSCTAAFYEAFTSICPPCSSPCTTCSAQSFNCTSCTSPRVLISNTCVCQSGTFQNSSLLCQACDLTCSTCVNTSITCLTCPINSNRVLNSTSCPCTSGYYHIGVVVCSSCSYTCLSCSTSSTTCTACPLSSYRTLSGSTCPCGGGYYDNGGTPTCSTCSPLCLTCQTYSQCLTCDSTRVYDPVALSCPCLSGSFASGNICVPCHYSCLSCSGSSSASCLTCAALRSFTPPFSCPCSVGLYQTAPSCSSCSLNCLSCSVSSSNCTSCHTGSFLSGGICQCNMGYFMNGIVCELCSSPCLGCSVTSTSCTSCDATRGLTPSGTTCVCLNGLYLGTLGNCLPCSVTCLTCTTTPSTCTSCNSSLSRQLTISDCLCLTGFFDSGVAQCQPCSSPCSTCNGPSSLNCTSCPAGYLFIGSSCRSLPACPLYCYLGTCLSSCPPTTYPAGSECTPCVSPCLTCQSSSLCSSCLSGSYFYPLNSSCLYACPIGTYQNTSAKTCVNCPSGCSSCSMRSTTVICSGCQIGYFFLSNTCVTACPGSNYVAVLWECLKCPSPCLTCTAISSRNCLSCLPQYFLHLGSCLLQCPQGYYSSSSQLCLLCPSICLTCLQGECVSCQPGYYLSHNQCTLQGNYVDEYNSSHSCHPNCLTCTNSSFSSCLLCNSSRGDHSGTAISGYCDCWKGSIDVGGGQCSRSDYLWLQEMNQALVSLTTSANYLSVMGSILIFNFYSSLILVNYQQVYSLFYYLNSSAVMQTDWVIENYGKMNINQYVHNHTHPNQPLSRRLQSRMLTGQTDSSLFLRGEDYSYLCDWAILSYVVLTSVAVLAFIVTKMNEHYLEKKNKNRNAAMKKVSGGQTFLRAAGKVINERLFLLCYLLTLPQVIRYGSASLKILVLTGMAVDKIKLVLSCLLLLIYLFYFFRLLYLVFYPSGNSEKIICFGFDSNKKKSCLSRLYLPSLILRNTAIPLMIVMASNYPAAQSASCLCVLAIFMLYSLCCCPYPKLVRVFLHFHELLLVGQVGILTASSRAEQTSKMQISLFLIFFNYAQIAVLIGLSFYLFLTHLCANGHDQGQVANEALIEDPGLDKDYIPENDPRLKDLTEENFTLEKINNEQSPQAQAGPPVFSFRAATFPQIAGNENSLSHLEASPEREESMHHDSPGQPLEGEIIRKRYRKRLRID